MPRNGSGVFSKPAGTTAISGDPIGSNAFNTLMDDFVSIANEDRAVVNGGTGASTPSGARTNLGLVIGTDVQAYNAGLADLAGLAKTDGNIPVGDGTNWVAESGATARASLGINEVATAAQYRDNTADKVLETDIVWAAMAEVSLSDGATIAWDMSSGIDFTVTLGGNRTLGNPTNTQVGKRGRIRVVQDGTGSRTLAYSSNIEFAGGSAPTLSTTAADEDVLYYDCISATRILIGSVLDIS